MIRGKRKVTRRDQILPMAQMALIYLLSAFLIFPLQTLAATASVSIQKSDPTQRLFQFKPALRRILQPNGQLYFQACSLKTKTCERITRNITFRELQVEHLKLQKEMQNNFRASLPTGMLLFSDSWACTTAGAMIASVPGVAGGAMVCLNLETQKIEITDLPLNLQALELLARELGQETSLIARGPDGEVYVANPNRIFDHLKNKYPVEADY